MLNLKEKINKMNLPRKIGSICLAIITYILIYNIYDPIITVRINDINIQIENSQAITSQNKVFTVIGDKTVDVYVKGKQSLVKNLTNNDIKAVANLKNLSITNAVEIETSIPFLQNEDIEITFENNNTIHLELDNYVTKSFPIQINKENELPNNYYLFSDNNQSSIKISGAQEEIKKINSVAITVNQNKLAPNYSKSYEIKVYDSFGTELSTENLTLSKTEYTYSPTIYYIKEIPINLNLIGSVPFGYLLEETNFEPKTIKISSNNELLDKYNEININYDVSETTESKKIVLDIKDYLPKEVILINNISEMNVTIKTDKLILKDFIFSPANLSIKNLKEEHTYRYVNNKEQLKLTLMGKESLLNELTIDKISPYIDIENKEEGIYTLSIKIPDSLDLTQMSEPKVEIVIVKMIEITPSPTPSPTPMPTEPPTEENQTTESTEEIIPEFSSEQNTEEDSYEETTEIKELPNDTN